MQLYQQSGFPNAVQKVLFEKVKRGEIDQVKLMVEQQKIDLKTIQDEQKNFCQTPIFSACIVPNHDLAYQMIVLLVELGCDPCKEDSLK